MYLEPPSVQDILYVTQKLTASVKLISYQIVADLTQRKLHTVKDLSKILPCKIWKEPNIRSYKTLIA